MSGFRFRDGESRMCEQSQWLGQEEIAAESFGSCFGKVRMSVSGKASCAFARPVPEGRQHFPAGVSELRQHRRDLLGMGRAVSSEPAQALCQALLLRDQPCMLQVV